MSQESRKTASTASRVPAAPSPGNTLLVEERKGKSRERLMAEVGLSPVVPNVNTARRFMKEGVGELDLTASVSVMREMVGAVRAGDLSGLEETLTAQAVALDAIFNEMARRAALNMGEYINATEIYLRLGLKAQGQCRATLQTLFEMRNPRPIAFVKQANISNGPQQVNNGAAAVEGRAPAPAHARGEISANTSNEVLELNHEPRLDTGTQGTAGGAHPRLETVGTRHRPED